MAVLKVARSCPSHGEHYIFYDTLRGLDIAKCGPVLFQVNSEVVGVVSRNELRGDSAVDVKLRLTMIFAR